MTTYLPLEARLALEWWKASGERTDTRLRSLVDHYCETNAIMDEGTRYNIFMAALAVAMKSAPTAV